MSPALWVVLPVTAAGAALGRRVMAWRAARKTAHPAGPHASPSGELSRLSTGTATLAPRLLEALAVLALAAGAAVLTSNYIERRTVRVQARVATGDWAGALNEARHIPRDRYPLVVSWDVARALYHQGRLPHDMFTYLQPERPPFLLAPADNLARMTQRWQCLKLSDIYLDLGRVNEAEHAVYEAMEELGDLPILLKRLALIAMTKGQVEAARIVLRVLERDPVLGWWAAERLERLRSDPTAGSDPDVRRLRSVMIIADYLADTTMGENAVVEILLRTLLDRNRQNRMAFEYLMAHYLVTGQLTKIAGAMDLLDQLGYAATPRAYEEALLLYVEATGRSAGPRRQAISPETRERFRLFLAALARVRENKEADVDLATAFGDSYFYYSYHRFPSSFQRFAGGGR
jgi:hypothetical protein